MEAAAQRLLAGHRFLRSLTRSLWFVAVLLASAVDCMVRRPEQGAEGAVWMHKWCRRFAWALGLKCGVTGVPPESGAVVSNHLSYLDILLLGSVRPFIMVAKTEVREWPLIGWLTMRAGTIYVKRGGGPATYPAVNAAMAEAYSTGLPVLFFPEGTTTNGIEILPFRRGLFHSVLNNAVPLRTAAMRYSLERHALNGDASVEDHVCWWGDMDFATHIFRFLALKGVRMEIAFGDEVLERADRFALSETARESVVEMYEGLAERAGTAAEWEREGQLAEAL